MNVSFPLLTNTGDEIMNIGMNLFGIPYQFPENVDTRVNGISSRIGKTYLSNIVLSAPVVTLIPGKPKFMSGKDQASKESLTIAALLSSSGADSDMIENWYSEQSSNEIIRIYDFEQDFTEYMRYVNILCRIGAGMLGIEDTIYTKAGEYSFEKFDWRNYRWNDDAYLNAYEKVKSAVKDLKNLSKPKKPDYSGMSEKQKKSAKKAYKKEMKDYKLSKEQAEKIIGENPGLVDEVTNSEKTTEHMIEWETIDTDDVTNMNDVVSNFIDYNYIQFYCDPESASQDSITNTTTSNSLKSLFQSAQGTVRDIAFMVQSGSADSKDLTNLANGAMEAITGTATELTNAIGGLTAVVDRVLSLSKSVVQGENVIIPDIYESSTYNKTYNITVNLRSPYGNALSYYMDIFVPLMHLLAFAVPRQGSANTYKSPFMVKGYMEGLWSINMGYVTDISIQKNMNSINSDGLATEVSVTLTIQDMYADLTMTPSQKPMLFLDNSSLVEFLATTCGLSLSKLNSDKRLDMYINSIVNSFTDIIPNISNEINDTIVRYISQTLSLW